MVFFTLYCGFVLFQLRDPTCNLLLILSTPIPTKITFNRKLNSYIKSNTLPTNDCNWRISLGLGTNANVFLNMLLRSMCIFFVLSQTMHIKLNWTTIRECDPMWGSLNEVITDNDDPKWCSMIASNWVWTTLIPSWCC